MMVWRDIRVKYKQSVMGFMWSIFMPMFVVCAGVLVRYAMATVSGKPMELSQLTMVSVKALPWSFLVSSIRFGTNSLIGNGNLVTKIYFPKEIFPIAAVLSNFFDFLIGAGFLTIILTLSRVGLNVYLLWMPVLILILIVLAIALSMILSALNLFFRDVKHLVEVALTFAIFFTPVLYEVEMFRAWADLLLLNPVAPILESLGSCVVLHAAPQLGWILYSGVVSWLLLIIAYSAFKRMEPKFAESI